MFSMCSELTPRAPIPDTRIPQVMQPCLYGEAKETMKRAIRIINDLDNTGMETLDLFLPKLRMYLLGVLPSIELKNDEKSDCTIITTTTRVTTTATSPTTEAALLLSGMSTTSDTNASDDIQISATSIAVSKNSDDIQSVVLQKGEFVRERTAARIFALHSLLEKTEPGSLLSLFNPYLMIISS